MRHRRWSSAAGWSDEERPQMRRSYEDADYWLIGGSGAAGRAVCSSARASVT